MNKTSRFRLWRRTLVASVLWFAAVMALDSLEVNGVVQAVFFFGGLIVVGAIFRASLGAAGVNASMCEPLLSLDESDAHRKRADEIDEEHRTSPAYASMGQNVNHAEYEREQSRLIHER